MAHNGRIAFALAALALVAGGARAVELGALEVASAIGEPLDARVPLSAQPGERFEAACFYLTHAGLPPEARLALTLERSARGTSLRIRGTTPLEVPAATLGIGVACPGREPQPLREFALLLDPRSRIRPATVAPAAPAPAIGATITARGDSSLESLARTLVPDDARARATYLEALGTANPGIASRGTTATIEPGTAVALPDLRTYAATRRAAAQGQVPASRAETTAGRQPAETELAPPPRSAPRPAAPQVASPKPGVAAPAPIAATPTEGKAERAPAASPVAKAPPRPAPPAEAAPAPARPAATAEPANKVAPAAPRTQAAAAKGGSEGAFVLRLSGAEIDLSRSRGIDDRRRAQLRERQLVLDADDQLSALLAMKHSLKQLEARVSELQLKLAGMPASFPERPAAAPKAAPAEAARAPSMPDRPRVPEAASPKAAEAAIPKSNVPDSATPGTPAPSSTPAAAATAPPAATTTIPTAPAAPTPPASIATPPQATPAAPAKTPSTAGAPAVAPPAATVPAKPAPAKKPGTAAPPSREWDLAAMWRDYGAWIGGALVLLLLVLAFAAWRRRRAMDEDSIDADDAPEEGAGEAAVAGDIGEIAAPVAAPPAQPERASISSDAHLPTRLRDTESGDLRRRYIEERFPEVASRAIRLEDTDSVVKGARLFYEDGELPRAVELLQLAIEARPAEVRLWLALFEIFRLERLSGEFGELALRFQKIHGESDHWRKVQFFGREVDPGNPLYKVEPAVGLETIGPREARKIAAARATFDPITENWLNAPMDFENEVLANDLRRSLMAEAGIAEQDLEPAPLSALRNVEMFTVA